MSSFFVPRVRGYAVLAGNSVAVNGVAVFEDSLPLAAVVVLGDDLVVCGGEGKRVVGLRVAADGSVKQEFAVESSRKIARLAQLATDEVVVVDSSGAVKALSVAGETALQMRDLYAHFAPVTAVLVLGPHIVTADIDGQVRVAPVSNPREISHFLLGNGGTVMSLLRGSHDLELVCVSRELTAKYFNLASGLTLQVDPFANAGKQIQSTKSRKPKKAAAEPAAKKNRAEEDQ